MRTISFETTIGFENQFIMVVPAYAAFSSANIYLVSRVEHP